MEDTKVALLLLPDALLRSHGVIKLLRITKRGGSVSFETSDLTAHELSKYFPNLSKSARDVIVPFSFERLLSFEQKIKQRFILHRAGVDRENFLRNAMLRKLHQFIETLKPFTQLVKWYHKVEQEKGRFKIAPCNFSGFRPRLFFEVIEESGGLYLHTFVDLNGSTYEFNSFSRFAFLLESKNEYFILSFMDYQTIEWLTDNNPNQYADDAQQLSQLILTTLEENYKVNRNNYFKKKEVFSKPVNRVMLSELNNSFLMLSPQFIYDGWLVDGPWKETFEKIADGEEIVVKRDKAQEEALISLLISLHPNFVNQKNGYYYLSFADAQRKQWFLKTYHKLLDLGIELTGMDMLHHFRYSQHLPETLISFKKEINNTVLLEMSLHFGREEVELASLQKMLLAGQKAVLLKDSSLGVLGDDWFHRFAAIIKHGKINKSEIEVPKYLAIIEQQSTREQEVLKQLVKQQWWQKWKVWQTGTDEIYPLPGNVKATLRPYQQKGYEWFSLLAEAGAGGCLADDMGLGKTLQTICFLGRFIQQHPHSKNIIVCPSSLIYNWQQELQKFAPTISVLVFHGVNRNAAGFDDSTQVIITSYGTVRVDAPLLLTKTFGVAVIDESHNIKNPTAQITTAVSQLNAAHRIALSGTPVVNNTFDLYSQLNFALPGMFGTKEFFKREYADAIDRNQDEDKLKMLQKLTSPFILRRTKEQVAPDLPEKTETILWCKMHRDQQNLYDDIKDQIRGSLFLDIENNGLNKSKLAVIQGMLKLRQICNSPLLLPVDERQSCTRSVKTEVLMSELKNILAEHKALVFSQFSSMLKLLAADLQKQGIGFYHFDGQTPLAKRSEMVNAFQNRDSTTNLFLISLKAGNTGLTLTSADYVFLFDPWWNTAVEQQAIDRTHRIGQTKNVFAYKMICKDTIEEKIIQLQQRKKKIAEDLVSENDGFIKALNEDDIAYLFS